MRKYSKIWLLLFVLSAFLFLHSCAATPENKPSTTVETIDTNPKIAFVNYRAQRGDDGKIKVELINKIIREGKIKGGRTNGNTAKTEFSVVQLNAGNELITSENIENPLSKNVEFVNDNGEFEMKLIELKEAEFSVRIQLQPNTKFIALWKTEAQLDEPVSLIITEI